MPLTSGFPVIRGGRGKRGPSGGRRGPAGRPAHLVDGVPRTRLTARQAMGVGAEREPGVGVAEVGAQGLDALPGVEEHRGVEVPLLAEAGVIPRPGPGGGTRSPAKTACTRRPRSGRPGPASPPDVVQPCGGDEEIPISLRHRAGDLLRPSGHGLCVQPAVPERRQQGLGEIRSPYSGDPRARRWTGSKRSCHAHTSADQSDGVGSPSARTRKHARPRPRAAQS